MWGEETTEKYNLIKDRVHKELDRIEGLKMVYRDLETTHNEKRVESYIEDNFEVLVQPEFVYLVEVIVEERDRKLRRVKR